MRRCNSYLACGDQRYRYAHHTTQLRPGQAPRIGCSSAPPPQVCKTPFTLHPRLAYAFPCPITFPYLDEQTATTVAIGQNDRSCLHVRPATARRGCDCLHAGTTQAQQLPKTTLKGTDIGMATIVLDVFPSCGLIVDLSLSSSLSSSHYAAYHV